MSFKLVYSSHLHLLLIRQRIDYKIATITYKVRQTNTPVYMASLISDYITSRTSGSSDKLLLYQPATTLTFSQKAFAFDFTVPSGTDFCFTVNLLQLLTVLNANSKRF